MCCSVAASLCRVTARHVPFIHVLFEESIELMLFGLFIRVHVPFIHVLFEESTPAPIKALHSLSVELIKAPTLLSNEALHSTFEGKAIRLMQLGLLRRS